MLCIHQYFASFCSFIISCCLQETYKMTVGGSVTFFKYLILYFLSDHQKSYFLQNEKVYNT